MNPLSAPWLLVATPQLQDPNFKKSVVLIVEHTSAGSMGFIINRPIQTSLADLVTSPKIHVPDNIPGWYGGPVETGTGIILHSDKDSIALSSSEETLVDLVDYSEKRMKELALRQAGDSQAPLEPLYPYRFLVGYSGWGEGQLMDEIRQGAWLQTAASPEMIFRTNWQTLWDKAIGKVGVNPKAFAVVDHSYLN